MLTSTHTRMHLSFSRLMMIGSLTGLTLAASPLAAQTTGTTASPADSTIDPVKTMVARLDLEQYKATVKGLTSSAIGARARIAIAPRSTGSRRSSRATAAPDTDASRTSTSPRRRAHRSQPSKSLGCARARAIGLRDRAAHVFAAISLPPA